jgi:hypothetical protein
LIFVCPPFFEEHNQDSVTLGASESWAKSPCFALKQEFHQISFRTFCVKKTKVGGIRPIMGPSRIRTRGKPALSAQDAGGP